MLSYKNRSPMRNNLQITISNCRGTRHLTLNQLARRILAGGLATAAVLFLTGMAVIGILNGKVGGLNSELRALEEQSVAITAENARLMEEQRRLQSTVEEKARAVLAMSDEIDNIETLIGLRPQPELPLHQRLNTAAQTAAEKQMMLDSIPSGFPVESEHLTSNFGMRMHPVRQRTAMHGGVDLRAPRGTPIYVTADGVVERASSNEESGMGKMVRVVHNYGFTTVYAHLDQIDASVGDYVRRGDLVGYAGSTGLTDGPHLHYEVRYLQRRLNPRPFLDWSLEDYDVLFSEEDHVQWDSLVEIVRTTANLREQPLYQQGHSLSAISP